MLLIFTEQSTIRLQYICKFVFEEVMGNSYSLTIDEKSFLVHQGNKINYSNKIFENIFQIKPVNLLFETSIEQQQITCFDFDNEKAFFKTSDSLIPFDIFAACFYLITRYEEYLPHTKDLYGRYAHENSFAFKNNFLNKPIINFWLASFKNILSQAFPTIFFEKKTFSFLPTYDIDMAWAYKEKGFIRNTGGFLKKPTIDRITSLLGFSDDPFDCFEELDSIHAENKLRPIYFFLVAKENGIYDKNILPDNIEMQSLIKSHAQKYSIGLHPSWKSFEGETILIEEKSTLEKIVSNKITLSRQHYLKFELPETYNRLVSHGILNDYSMGYGSINGFRASVASSYLWYNLQSETITRLRVHPFCFMDANSFYEQKFSVEESYNELLYYYKICKKLDLTFITIFHNSILGKQKEFTGWMEMYKKFIKTL